LAYKLFLKSGGCVYQKTDDRPFFEYSLSKFNEHGFNVQDVTELLNDGKIDNIQTEYEKKFKALGIKANMLIAKKV
jgi:tRNA (guanine-N7-)-methyltransferase